MELKKIALLHTDDVGNEFEAIRQTLEYFGYDVFRKAIGRPADYIEGNAALLFIYHFFYQLTVAPSDVGGAFQKARSIDKETKIFTWNRK
jgi:hypothetical protein